ncbi:MAG: Peptide deformylase 1 [Anaerolineae bacterium]|nr:Peptide deformylase 1 [Anaerolineae bacterium]RIK34190.1 MAG: peptide deformylase [Chloroflexota bacterium]
MAVREILTSEHPALRHKAKRIKKIDASLQKLIDDMIETMEDAPGQGLAAPQIGIALRVIVVDALPGEDDADTEKPVRLQLVNPEIVEQREEQFGEEGCLSIPGYVGNVRRAKFITVRALNRKGKEVRFKASHNLARVLQHEIDHLDGILYTDRIEKPEDLFRLNDKGERIPVFQAAAANAA